VKLLLDTHIAVWSMLNSSRLSVRGRELLDDPTSQLVVSAVSIWEIAIKHNQRRAGAIPFSGTEALERLERSGASILDITRRHAAAVDHLAPIHGDPFDRMLIAQALTEPLRLVTSDAMLARYSDTVILV